MSTITRDTFLIPGYEKVAATETTTMYTYDEEGNAQEVPVPASIKESGVIPEGYSVDFIVDPLTLVKALLEKGITEESEIQPELLQQLKDTTNSAENLRIIPTSLYEEKLALVKQSLEQ